MSTGYINIMTAHVNTPVAPDPSETALAAAMAHRLAAIRKVRNLSFDELARRSGVSKGTLVQIEQERANPSISTLCRLAAALGVSVADLVAPVEAPASPVTVIGANETHSLWTGPAGGSAVLLAGTPGPDMLELWQWHLKPGERLDSAAHSRGTRELIHVTSGKLIVAVGGVEAVIPAGASAIAQTNRAHSYANPGPSPAQFYMTVHEPPATN